MRRTGSLGEQATEGEETEQGTEEGGGRRGQTTEGNGEVGRAGDIEGRRLMRGAVD